MWRWFTDPTIRQIYSPDERHHHSRAYVADLRASITRRGPPGTSNIDHLSLLRVLGHDDFIPAAPERR